MNKTHQDDVGDLADANLCYRLRILIRHQDEDLSFISKLVNLQPKVFATKGSQRISSAGKILSGVHNLNVWSYWLYVRHSRKFSSEVARLLDVLGPCADLFKRLVSSGGQAMLIIELQGNANIGDVLTTPLLSGLAKSGLSLGIEVFPTLEE